MAQLVNGFVSRRSPGGSRAGHARRFWADCGGDFDMILPCRNIDAGIVTGGLTFLPSRRIKGRGS